MRWLVLTVSLLCAVRAAVAADSAEFPPGWLPLNKLEATPSWSEFRKITDKVHLYLPANVKTYRGAFVCYVFHSQDPRELADAWQFALITIPWPFEYDLGHNDKRNGRFELGHPVGNMARILQYLEIAARETKHPELAVAPLVGWVGQNGSHLGHDLWRRAPDRVIAWGDSFPNTLAKYLEFTTAVPFAYAWEISRQEEQQRQADYVEKHVALRDRPTPPPDLKARANTYGFPHGIYSKYSYVVAYLDRCIRARLPPEPPLPGQPVPLRPCNLMDGWAGDYAPVGEWNAIAPVKEAIGMVDPQWFPDEYCAWVWRAYHTAHPDVAITSPVIAYKKGGDPVNGGSGYSPPVAAADRHTLTATAPNAYSRIEFRDGHRLLGTAVAAPWKLTDVQFDPGLHALIAIGVKPDGQRTSSRPAFLMVK